MKRAPRAPSIKHLKESLNIDTRQARLVRSLIKGTVSTWGEDLFPKSNRYFNTCHTYYTRRVLHCLNEVMEMHGVEALTRDGEVVAEYLNSGGTYTPTLMYIKGKFRISSVGDYAERNRVD